MVDEVMGGKSHGDLSISSDGYAVYQGMVSLENSGGFSYIRLRHDPMVVDSASKIVTHLKGDGKNYQLRIKNKIRDYYSYVNYFETFEEWEKVEILLDVMCPSFRGEKLRMNFVTALFKRLVF